MKKSMRFVLLTFFSAAIILSLQACVSNKIIPGSFRYVINKSESYSSISTYFEIKPNRNIYKIEYTFNLYDANGNLLDTIVQSRGITVKKNKDASILDSFFIQKVVESVEITNVKILKSNAWVYALAIGVVVASGMAFLVFHFIKLKSKGAKE